MANTAVKGIAQEFGIDLVKNGADRHDATRALINCDPAG
jgi:hypothetical protein